MATKELTTEEKAALYDEQQAALPAGNGKPARFKVVESLNRGGADRVLFSSVSEKRARAHLERTCPRGSHHHLVLPDGSTESYEAERTGAQGEDVEPWASFDRDAYQAPELAPVNTNDPWADAWEGAQ